MRQHRPPDFRLQYAVAGLLLLPGAFLLGRRRPVFVVALLAISSFNASYLTPYIADGDAAAVTPERDRDSVSVLLWNTWRKNGDFASVNELIARTDADVVILQETTETIRGRLADLEETFRILVVGGDAALIRRSSPHRAGKVRGQPYRAFRLDLTIGSDHIEMLATHLLAPLSARAAKKRGRQLEAIADWVNGRGSPVAVLGDLNATPWSFELTDLRRLTDLEDSLVGRGLQPTWPFHNALTSLLGIPLDHCLYSPDVVILERSVGDAGSSNHRPLFVRLALAD